MSDKKEPLEKLLQIREFGDSLYVPLTKHLKALNLKRDQIAKVFLRNEKEIVITRPEDK